MTAKTAVVIHELDRLILTVKHSIQNSKTLISQSRDLIDTIKESRLRGDSPVKNLPAR